MIDLYNQGKMEEAADLQYFVTKVIDVISKNGGGIVAGKAIMGLCGIECGQCRLPLPSVSAGSLNQMKEELESINFFDHV